MVVGIEFAADQIARLELDEFVGTGADGREVVRRLAGLGAFIVREQMFRDDGVGRADKGVGPERRRLLEGYADGEVVDFLDGDVAVSADGHGGGGGVAGVFPVEHHVIGGERFAVVPFDAGLELPGYRYAVGRQAAILQRGNFGGQNQLHVAVGVPAGERLIEQARAVLVLGAGGEMRIEQGRSLPPQQFQRTAAAALGRLVGGRALGHGHAANGQKLRGHGRGETEGQHTLNEAAAVHAPVLHFVDHGAQFVVQHRCPLSGSGVVAVRRRAAACDVSAVRWHTKCPGGQRLAVDIADAKGPMIVCLGRTTLRRTLLRQSSVGT